MQRIHHFFNTPVPAAPLLVFRLIFGALMIFSTLRFMYLGWIEDHYTNPTVHFSYYGFEWVKPLSTEAMYALHILMIIASLVIMFGMGWMYRIAAIMLFMCFTYTELIDLTYYLNHYYFVSLISFLLIFSPANISPTLPTSIQYVKRSAVWIIKFQITVLYVYAGLAKINYDWLINALPLKIWLPAHYDLPVIGPLFSWWITPYLFSWVGMLYDTFIIFFLINDKTRIAAFITVVVFHTITGILFQIGVFPMVMVCMVLIFFSDEWHIKVLNRIFRKKTELASAPRKRTVSNLINYLLLGYVSVQLLFPWRYLLYPGNLFWTEEGYRFSWRVMLMEKAGTATFYVKDSKNGKEGIVVNSEFLNAHQEKQMTMQPDMILQFAHFLGSYYEKKGMVSPQVRAEVYVTLNAKPSKLLIDPNRDLMKEYDSFKPKDWIKHYPD